MFGFDGDSNDRGVVDDAPQLFDTMRGGGGSSRGSKESVEQSFGLQSGRYRHDDGEFATGSPPEDYDTGANRFRANDGQFKNRSQDLGRGTEWDAPAEDASNPSHTRRMSDRGALGKLFDI